MLVHEVKYGDSMSTEKECPSCGAKVFPKSHFCLVCGYELLGLVITPPPVSTPLPQAINDAPQEQLVPSNAVQNTSGDQTPDHAPLAAAQFEPIASQQPVAASQSVAASQPIATNQAIPANQPPANQPHVQDQYHVSSMAQDIHRSPTPTPESQKLPTKPRPDLDLVLIRSPELESVRFHIKREVKIGREKGNMIFKDDPYISPLHATIYFNDDQLFVRDEQSLNGVYVRLKGSTEIKIGETFIAGEQLYRINHPSPEPAFVIDATDDSTRFFANHSIKSNQNTLMLTQVLEGGQTGLSVPLGESSIRIGRQECDLNFPHDRFMSSRHCHVSVDNNQVTLTDLGSRNGTFVKLASTQNLAVGDYLLIGKQLIQVQPHQA